MSKPSERILQIKTQIVDKYVSETMESKDPAASFLKAASGVTEEDIRKRYESDPRMAVAAIIIFLDELLGEKA